LQARRAHLRRRRRHRERHGLDSQDAAATERSGNVLPRRPLDPPPPALARAIGRRYPIGDHTFDHADQIGLSSAQIRADVRRGAWWIRVETGRNPWPLFRFPYGARDTRTIAVVNSMGYASVRWSIDTWGWMGPSEGQSVGTVVRRVADQLEPGAIVLMHVGVAKDGSLLDAQALPRVISLVRARGYRFVTLDGFVHAPR